MREWLVHFAGDIERHSLPGWLSPLICMYSRQHAVIYIIQTHATHDPRGALEVTFYLRIAGMPNCI